MSYEGAPSMQLTYPLKLVKGWSELLQSDKSTEYQLWFRGWVDLAVSSLAGEVSGPAWHYNEIEIAYRCQQALEFVALNGMSWDVSPSVAQGPRLAKAMGKMDASIGEHGWVVPGVSFYLPKRHPLDARSDR